MAILTTIKRKKIHRDQHSIDNAVCCLFCQPFYVVMLFFPLVTTYLRIKSVQIHFLSGTSIPNLEEFSSPCWVSLHLPQPQGFREAIGMTHTFPLWDLALGGRECRHCSPSSHWVHRLWKPEPPNKLWKFQPPEELWKARVGASCRDCSCRSIQRRCRHPRPLCQPKRKKIHASLNWVMKSAGME